MSTPGRCPTTQRPDLIRSCTKSPRASTWRRLRPTPAREAMPRAAVESVHKRIRSVTPRPRKMFWTYMAWQATDPMP
eukprot:3886880-Alexandrium_andersonii.AAC.1